MPVSQLIGRGVGFTPGSVKYIVTHGLSPSAAVTYLHMPPGLASFTGGVTESGFAGSVGEQEETGGAS